MLHRRKFILGTATLVGATLLSSSISFKAFAVTNDGITSGQDKYAHLMKRWIALYDVNGGFVTEIKLVRMDEESTSEDIEQFSLRWKIREEMSLSSGMYMLEDFANTPHPIYLEPSFSKRRNGIFYRASFSLLKN
jgi:hypothetical protein